MTFLTRIDPTKNISRFYVVQLMPSLFGDWTVLREWGRRGSPGTVRLNSYQRRNDAETAERRTIKAGGTTATRFDYHEPDGKARSRTR
jgi:predicted DNA-binding WGR domain protein